MKFDILQFKDNFEELAEDIGHHVGDGCLRVWTTKEDCSVRHSFFYSGHAIDDREYFERVLIPRKNKLYSLNKSNYTVRNNEIRFCFNSKELSLFYQGLGIAVGSKKNISIPNFVMNAGVGVKQLLQED